MSSSLVLCLPRAWLHAGALACCGVAAARAADVVVDYQLYGAQLSDGSAVAGTFSYDFTTKAATVLHLTAGPGVFDLTNTSVSASGMTGTYVAGIDPNITQVDLQISLATPLAADGVSEIVLASDQSSVVVTYTSDVSETVQTLTFTAGMVTPVAFLPRTSIALAGTAGSHGWFRGPVTATLSTVAGFYPVARTWYILDGGSAAAYAAPIGVAGDGVHSVTYWSVDTHGLVETAHTAPVDIDTVPPATTSAVYLASRVTLAATDATSGVGATYYTIDGGARQTYAVPFVAATLGPHTVKYWSVDVAGNVEAAHTVALTSVDVTPPTTPGAPHLLSSTATTKTATWTASKDNVGVVKYVLYQLRGHSGRGGGFSWVPIASSTTNHITLPTKAYTNVEVAAFDAAGNASPRSAPGSF